MAVPWSPRYAHLAPSSCAGPAYRGWLILGHVLEHIPGYIPRHVLKHVPEYMLKHMPQHVLRHMPYKNVLEQVLKRMAHAVPMNLLQRTSDCCMLLL